MNITVNRHQEPSMNCIKYLGLHIDKKWNFTEHARIVAVKAGNVVRRLSYGQTWETINGFIREVLQKKAAEERRRQAIVRAAP